MIQWFRTFRSAAMGPYVEPVVLYIPSRRWPFIVLRCGYQIEQRNLFGCLYVARLRLWIRPIQYK